MYSNKIDSGYLTFRPILMYRGPVPSHRWRSSHAMETLRSLAASAVVRFLVFAVKTVVVLATDVEVLGCIRLPHRKVMMGNGFRAGIDRFTEKTAPQNPFLVCFAIVIAIWFLRSRNAISTADGCFIGIQSYGEDNKSNKNFSQVVVLTKSPSMVFGCSSNTR
jgi:hypothetical protein